MTNEFKLTIPHEVWQHLDILGRAILSARDDVKKTREWQQVEELTAIRASFMELHGIPAEGVIDYKGELEVVLDPRLVMRIRGGMPVTGNHESIQHETPKDKWQPNPEEDSKSGSEETGTDRDQLWDAGQPDHDA